MKRNRFDCWSGFVAMLARRSGEANVRYPTECKIPYRRTLLGTCILHRILRISGVPVSHTRTGEFIPFPWRFFGSRLWRARNSKSCSLALKLAEDRPFLAERQNRFVDEVAGPFVVDHGARAEFSDGKESGPRDRKRVV